MPSVARPTAHERFATLFDVYQPPVDSAAHTRAFSSTAATSVPSGTVGFGGRTDGGEIQFVTPQPVYGFGTASLRFNNVDFGQRQGLVNKQVIELSEGAPLPIGEMAPGALSNTLPAYAAHFVPEDGRTFGRTPAFGPADKTKAYVLPKPHFVNNQLTAPDVVEVSVPRGAAGSLHAMHEVPSGIITPLERREALAFERSLQRARLAHRAEKGEAVRRAQLARLAHPHGMAGVEAPGSYGTQVYAAATAALSHEAAAAGARSAARAEYLRGKINSNVGYPLLEHASDDTPSREKLFQSRARTAHSVDAWSSRGEAYALCPSVNLHPLRQPSNNQERVVRPHDEARAQRIWNAKEGGRNFDIISGVEKTVRCTVPERIDLRRAHESLVAAANAKATTWAGGLGRYGPATST